MAGMSVANGARAAATAPLKTANYQGHPRASLGFNWDRGRFQRHFVPAMLQDPGVLYCLGLLMAPVFTAKIEFASADPAVAEFAGRLMRRLWDVHLPRILVDLLSWGSAGGEAASRDEGGQLVIGAVKRLQFHDRRPWLEGGEVAGVNAYNVPDAGREPVELRRPGRWFWLSHGGEEPWGWPAIAGLWRPWNKKTQPKGVEDSLRLYSFRHAFGGDTLYHPEGTVLVGTQQVACNSYADEMLAKRENGASLALPSTTDKNGKKLWELAPGKPGESPDFLLNYSDRLDAEYFKGAGIPQEVVEAAASGSGYSGRSVPMRMFLSQADQTVGVVARGLDACLVRPHVHMNYGPGAAYEVKPKSLVPQDDEGEDSPKGKSQGRVDADPPTAGADPVPPAPAQLSADGAAHAPAGGVAVAGKQFVGGQFIPAEVMAQATPAEKAAVAGATPPKKSDFAKAVTKSAGPAVAVDKLRDEIRAMTFTPEQDTLVNVFFGSARGDLRDMPEYAKLFHIHAFQSVVAKLPKKAVERVSRHLGAVRVHATSEPVTKEWLDRTFGLHKLKAGEAILGFYSTHDGALWVDGVETADAENSRRGVWSHEMGHVIDGPKFELSKSPEWQEAFAAEIAGKQLSDYAATSACEGFAEFCRAVYGTDVERAKVAALFPRCTAFFQKRKLI